MAVLGTCNFCEFFDLFKCFWLGWMDLVYRNGCEIERDKEEGGT